MNISNRIIQFLSILLLGVYFLSTVDYYIPETIIFIFLPLILIGSKPKMVKNSVIISFLIFLIVIIVDQVFNEKSIMSGKLTAQIYIGIFIWLILSIYFNNRKSEYFRITKISLYFIFITILISLVWVQFIPDIIRNNFQSGVSSSGAAEDFNYYSKFGLMSYGFGHAIPILFPILVLIGKKENGIKKYLILISVLLSLFLLFGSTITTSFFLGAIIALSALVLNTKNKIYLYTTLGILLFLGTIWGRELSIWTLENLSPYAENTMMEGKIRDVLLSIKYENIKQGQVGIRFELYETSWKTFIENPILGRHDPDSIGGHAFFIDYFAYFGVLAFMPFLLVISFHVQYFLQRINNALKPYYKLSVFYFIAISLVKGSPAREMYAILFFILPGLALYTSSKYFEQKDHKKNELQKRTTTLLNKS